MNAPLAKEQIALLMSDSLTVRSSVVPGTDSAYAEPRPSGLAAMGRWLREVFAELATWPERRATYAELAAMTDRDLADIGLERAELRRVFDPQFARAQRR